MPIISIFYGIIVRMYFRDHNPPHFHAEYQDYKITIDLEGNVLKGEFPQAQLRMVLAWLEIHREELLVDWKLASEDDVVFKIKPLK